MRSHRKGHCFDWNLKCKQPVARTGYFKKSWISAAFFLKTLPMERSEFVAFHFVKNVKVNR